MSELKAFVARKIDDGSCDHVPCIEVYPKSEADKVIADKDAKILALDAEVFKQKHHANMFFDERNYAENQLRHHKYKRCLAMAKWCRLHDEFTQLESERPGLPQRAIFMEYRRKAMWWNKWHKRWLAIAEQFKEAK